MVGNLTDGKTSDRMESRPGRRRRPLTDGKTSDTDGKTSQFEMETVVLIVQQWQLAEMLFCDFLQQDCSRVSKIGQKLPYI